MDTAKPKEQANKSDWQEKQKFLDDMVEKGKVAAGLFLQYTQEEVDNITRELVLAGIAHAYELADLAVQETQMGVREDKVLKNMVATEFVWNHIKDMKTVGVINEYPKQNLIEVAEPHGLIFGLTPVTNPTSTIIFKSITAIKTRNTIIFSPHNRAAKCSQRAAEIMAEAAERAGAPKDVIQCIPEAGRDDTEYMFRHPRVALIDATGGTNMVKAAYSAGKPALGVGAGNTPVYIEKSGDIEMAVVDILTSKSFDHGTVCASEQTVVVDEQIYDHVKERFDHYGAHICNENEVELLAKKTLHRGQMKPSMIGKSAHYIAEAAGIKINPETKIFLAPLKGVGADHPLSGEKLFPVLGFYKAKGHLDAINICLDINYHGGTGHTASIFSEDEEVIREFSEKINAGRIIVNSPSSIGALGGVYNDLIPTFSFGCGSGGGNITMDNISVTHFLNIKKVARRTTTSMWFRAPNEIYFNKHSLEHLRSIKSQTTLIITSPVNLRVGHVDMVKSNLNHVPIIQTHTDVSPEPPYSQVVKGVEMVKEFRPDTIIALGGGSVLDIAKAIRFFYEHPEFKFHDLKFHFLDPRKRVIEFPQEKAKTRLIAIPTTSGTGSEVTPMAVITDDNTHEKVAMVDYNLVPDIAIADANLTVTMPPKVTVDTGFDSLTHAIESMVSSISNDFTDGLALQTIFSVFNNLEAAFLDGNDIKARERLHNGSAMAGMAIANAFVGVNHSLAHAIGATFGVSHGRANAIFLPYSIRYNANIPTKFTPSPNVKAYKAHKKYAYIADMLRLGGETIEDKVDNLIESIRDLQKRCEIEGTFAEYGIPEKDFKDKMETMVNLAITDPSGRSNPRAPMMNELQELFLEAYYGKKIKIN